MKYLSELRKMLVGNPAPKYRIYRRGDGKYYVQYQDTYVNLRCSGQPYLSNLRADYLKSLSDCEQAIEICEKNRQQEKADSKITLVKEIKC